MFILNVEGAIARLRLDRPRARNAIPVVGWSELADRAEEAEGRGANLLILSGISGGAFCAGADLADFGRFMSEPAAATDFRELMRSGLERLCRLPIPTIAAIEGPCYGAGVALAMACDVRLADAGARFAITPAKLGISYPQEDVQRLVSLIGQGQAARLLFSAAPIDGVEAARIGLVDRYVADGLAAEVEHLAHAIAANDRASLRTLKRAIRLAADGKSSDPGQDRLFDDLFGSAALAQRLAAHRQRGR